MAISDFRSVCRRQRRAVARMPKMAMSIIGNVWFRLFSWSRGDVRRMPYPPSLRRVPAKIMEPAMGASTCALGSHR